MYFAMNGFKVFRKLVNNSNFGGSSLYRRKHSDYIQGFVEWKTTRRKRSSFLKTLSKPSIRKGIGVEFSVAGGVAIGIGVICYQGLQICHSSEIFDQTMVWPKHVRDRVKILNGYLVSSVLIAGSAAIMAIRGTRTLQMATKPALLNAGVKLAVTFGTGLSMCLLDYSPKFDAKHAIWMLHSYFFGAAVSALAVIGGVRYVCALWYAAGIVGSFSIIGICAPNERFIYTAGSLASALSAMLMSVSKSSLITPVLKGNRGILRPNLVYGGVVVLLGMHFYIIHHAIRMAESHNVDSTKPFDPINSLLPMYSTIVTVFSEFVSKRTNK